MCISDSAPERATARLHLPLLCALHRTDRLRGRNTSSVSECGFGECGRHHGSGEICRGNFCGSNSEDCHSSFGMQRLHARNLSHRSRIIKGLGFRSPLFLNRVLTIFVYSFSIKFGKNYHEETVRVGQITSTDRASMPKDQFVCYRSLRLNNSRSWMYERGIFNGLWLYGFRDEEERLPMQENSIFHLASITKQFTASAIILLKRQGLLCLEDRLTEYFRNSLRIKTRRSGIF